MLGIFTNDHDIAFAANDFALLANGLDRRSYFHVNTSLRKDSPSLFGMLVVLVELIYNDT